jgi:hypothetical protein
MTKLKLTIKAIMTAVEKDNGTGFCVACHGRQTFVEPDAKGYPCKRCGEPAVMGAEEMLMRVAR